MNFSVVDALLIVLVVGYLGAVVHLKNPLFTKVAVRAGLPIMALLLLGLVVLLLAGGRPAELLKDALSFAYLFVGLGLLLKTNGVVDLRPALWMAALSALTLAAVVLMQGGIRPAGTMPNPNLTSAWLGMAILCVVVTGYPVRRGLRLVLIVILVVAFLQAGSLGASMALMSALMVVRLQAAKVVRPIFPIMVVGAILLAFLALPYVERFTSTAAAEDSRIDRSAESRFEIWKVAWDYWISHPFGGGPGAFNESWAAAYGGVGADTHNDYLTLLTSVGIIGLLIWLSALWGLYSVEEKTQPLVVFLAVGSLTNGAMNMRSNYIFLALVLAWTYWGIPTKAADRRTESWEASLKSTAAA